jgi:hypothetical protein
MHNGARLALPEHVSPASHMGPLGRELRQWDGTT